MKQKVRILKKEMTAVFVTTWMCNSYMRFSWCIKSIFCKQYFS